MLNFTSFGKFFYIYTTFFDNFFIDKHIIFFYSMCYLNNEILVYIYIYIFYDTSTFIHLKMKENKCHEIGAILTAP